MTIDTKEIRSTIRRIEREGLTVNEESAEAGAALMRGMELRDEDVDRLCDLLDPVDTSGMDHEAIARRAVRSAEGDDDDGLAGVVAKLP